MHLRWSFLPELGWPAGGFEVRRRFWTIDEFLQIRPQAWTTLSTVSLPPTSTGGATVLARARTVVASGVSPVCSHWEPVRSMWINWYVADLKRCEDADGLEWWVSRVMEPARFGGARTGSA